MKLVTVLSYKLKHRKNKATLSASVARKVVDGKVSYATVYTLAFDGGVTHNMSAQKFSEVIHSLKKGVSISCEKNGEEVVKFSQATITDVKNAISVSSNSGFYILMQSMLNACENQRAYVQMKAATRK